MSRRISSLLLPAALALIFTFLAMRGVEGGSPVDPDAARHAMNGVLIYDMVRSGEMTRPVAFAKAFYDQYPTVSLPYHPPVFPAIEAAFYSVFGVSFGTARLAVAAAVFASVMLLYLLVLETSGAAVVAFAAVCVFLSLRLSQSMAADVMLEFPSLVFALGALYSIRRLPDGFSMRSALAFAALTTAAIWTKQHTIFLAAVPFLFAIFARRWRVLRHPPIWISAVLIGLGTAALLLISELTGVTVRNVKWPSQSIMEMLLHHAGYYSKAIVAQLGVPLALLVALGTLLLVIRRSVPDSPRGGAALHAAWLTAAALMLMALSPYSERYLFYIYPPLLTLTMAGLYRFAAPRIGTKPFAVGTVVLVGVLFLYTVRRPGPFLHGPDQAARLAAVASPGRILYCGALEGPFALALRSRDPESKLTLVRAEKLKERVSSPNALNRFVQTNGIDLVVSEARKDVSAACAEIPDDSKDFQLLGLAPLSGSDLRIRGEVRVYGVQKRSGEAAPPARLTQQPGGGQLDVKLND